MNATLNMIYKEKRLKAMLYIVYIVVAPLFLNLGVVWLFIQTFTQYCV